MLARRVAPVLLILGTAALLVAAGCAESDKIDDGGTGGSGASGERTTAAGSRGEGGSTTTSSGDGGGPDCSGPELCDGSVDEDCDGTIDEDCDCISGDTQPCFSGDPVFAGVGACVEGTQTCDDAGKWSACDGEVLPSDEDCDAIDNDCDASVDEGFEPEICGQGICQVSVETCEDGSPTRCVPLTPPDPNEDCDGVDDDCDGAVDEGCTCQNGQTQGCYTGPNGTQNVGICTGGTQTCSGGQWGPCLGEVTPGSEACDTLDQDCDGNTAEGSCNLPNSVSSCSGGGCTITGCNPGFSNCDASQTTGCETQHGGHSNTSPGEFLGTFDADSFHGLFCDEGGSCEGPIVSRQGTQGRFFSIDADEASSCCSFVAMRFELLVPAGVDYDLYLSGSGCAVDPAWQSLQGTGQTENIVVYCNDDCGGADNGFTVNVEVRYWSGASCQPYTLNVYRRNC